jgi:oligoribonuclease
VVGFALMAKQDTPLVLVWLDLEMTGLDPTRDAILDLAAIVTGPDLVEKGRYAATVFQPESALAVMDPFVREMHDKSGLTERVRKSQKGLRDVEKELFTLIHAHAAPFQAVLAGNSIHADRRFVAAYMPLIDRYLSYRLLDVTTVKLLRQAWFPQLEPPVKKSQHTAVSDVQESIAELVWYKEALFRKPA